MNNETFKKNIESINQDIFVEIEIIRDFLELLEEKGIKGFRLKVPTCYIRVGSGFGNILLNIKIKSQLDL